MNILSSGSSEESGQHTSVRLIFKSRKKGHEDKHPAGAWKIAYADFITAMMAFFLLMWILNVATDQQKKAIAQYFNPFGSSSTKQSQPHVLEGPTTTSGDTLPMKDLIPPEMIQESDDVTRLDEESQRAAEKALAQQESIQKTIKNIKEALHRDPLLKELQNNVKVEEVPEGVRLQIMDQDRFSMFHKGKSDILPRTRAFLDQVAQIIAPLPYPLSITGHTDAYPFQRDRGYSNWELSSDRAHACRRMLVNAGIPQFRIHSVIGKSDTELLISQDPLAPQNRRISIVLLYTQPPSSTDHNQP